MLRHLTIKDFVIVDRLELEFAQRFRCLTGETGAGKSILIDALALALGERADAGGGRVRAATRPRWRPPSRPPHCSRWRLGSNQTRISMAMRNCCCAAWSMPRVDAARTINGQPATVAATARSRRELGRHPWPARLSIASTRPASAARSARTDAVCRRDAAGPGRRLSQPGAMRPEQRLHGARAAAGHWHREREQPAAADWRTERWHPASPSGRQELTPNTAPGPRGQPDRRCPVRLRWYAAEDDAAC